MKQRIFRLLEFCDAVFLVCSFLAAAFDSQLPYVRRSSTLMFDIALFSNASRKQRQCEKMKDKSPHVRNVRYDPIDCDYLMLVMMMVVV